jgi:uncharacterized protein YjeT (DUF2065 family)
VTDFLAALALAIVIEGLLYAAFPEQMKKMLASILSMPASTIRAVALACAGVGLVLLWFARG